MKSLTLILLMIAFSITADEVKPQRITPGPGQESVWDYPRPPKVEKTSKQIRVIYDGVVIAETNRAVRVLETGHPPVYYIPREDVRMEYLIVTKRSSTCEFKGTASYYNMKGKTKSHENAAWSYAKPASGYELIRDHIAFYPKLMDACFVNGERVVPEPAQYYGGWITREIVGPFAGE
jgi:uncharacterized protein (DUF427 family)